MLEVTRIHQCFVHRSKIVFLRIQTRANAIDIAERGKELERWGEKTSAVKEVDQNLSARSDDSIAYRRRNERAGIKQKFGTCRARKVLLANWVEAIAVRPGSH